ncbi:MAG: hypothetical protein ACLT38_02980 [Akkermansia sp.]
MLALAAIRPFQPDGLQAENIIAIAAYTAEGFVTAAAGECRLDMD